MGRSKSKPKKSLFLRIGLFVFIIYLVILLVDLGKQINDKNTEINNLNVQISEYEHLNKDLQNKIDHPDVYLEQQAREKGYVSPGADVYKEIP